MTAALGASLPTKVQFAQLAVSLGYGSSLGYSPLDINGKDTVIPALGSDYMYWSSDHYQYDKSYCYQFDSLNGGINDNTKCVPADKDRIGMIRCVNAPPSR